MAPESTMAVILMESANVIQVVRSLTSWYGVTAETTIVFSGTTTGEALFHNPSASMTCSFGCSSFLTVNWKLASQWQVPSQLHVPGVYHQGSLDDNVQSCCT